MKQQTKDAYVLTNEGKINTLISRICLISVVVTATIVYGSYQQIFPNLLLKDALFWFALVCVLMMVLFILLRFIPDWTGTKYFILLSFCCVLVLMGKSNNMDVGMGYALIPLISVLYFNLHFSVEASVMGYIAMEMATWFRKDYIDGFYLNIKSDTYFQVYTVGHTMEYVIVISIVYGIVILTQHYLDQLYEQNYLLNGMRDKVIERFSNIIEMRDVDTGQHAIRTRLYVELLTNKLCENSEYAKEIPMDIRDEIGRAAPLHDIGKIRIPDNILLKPAKLTTEEFEVMKTHTTEGRNMVNRVIGDIEDESFLHVAREITLYHHERWNGTGYPTGLSGKSIPISARIMAVVDVFDALVSNRCYKSKCSLDEAFAIIKDETGTHFDPVIADTFLNLKDEIRTIVRENEI